MFNERGNGQFHIRIQRKRPYRGMKLLKTVSLPNAAGVSRAYWAPDAAQFARFNVSVRRTRLEEINAVA